jgi:hypothetical protein
MRESLPERLEDGPITLGIWLIGGSIVALLASLLL